MSDMHDSGYHAFTAWSKVDSPRQGAAMNSHEFYARWLGPFRVTMTGEEANRLLNHVGKITEHGQAAFIRGWEKARIEYKASIP